MTRRFVLSLAAGTALAGSFGGSALAGDLFGQHIARCARATLGQREAPPALTCACDRTAMTFANSGAMVEHLRTQG